MLTSKIEVASVKDANRKKYPETRQIVYVLTYPHTTALRSVG